MNEADIRQSLREWVLKKNDTLNAADLTDDLPIIERRIITSLQTMDLILFIEELSGAGIDVEAIKPGAFRNIDTICKNFFSENGK